jgi:hypothetical protein
VNLGGDESAHILSGGRPFVMKPEWQDNRRPARRPSVIKEASQVNLGGGA